MPVWLIPINPGHSPGHVPRLSVGCRVWLLSDEGIPALMLHATAV